MDELGFVDECCQCSEEYDYCECEPHETGFEFEGFMIHEPNVSVCGDRLVDPEVYYGEAYKTWMHKPKGTLHLDCSGSILDEEIEEFFEMVRSCVEVNPA
jgi:hypothetical protein